MKNRYTILISIFCLFAAFSTQAQETDSLLYKRFPTIPPFTIVQLPDSTNFSKKDLQKRKPLLIFIFSPDCPHCQIATRDLLSNYKAFKNIQIIMASPLEYKWLLPFYQEYKLEKYPAIKMGRDASNFFGTFFNVKNYPAMFLYDKKGDFVRAFSGHTSFSSIAGFIP